MRDRKRGSGLKENERDFWRQSIIDLVNKIDSKTSLMKIFYFAKVFLH